MSAIREDSPALSAMDLTSLTRNSAGLVGSRCRGSFLGASDLPFGVHASCEHPCRCSPRLRRRAGDDAPH
eukprot:3941442-Rhodomonas_salina.1